MAERGVNEVTIMGRLGQDPDLRKTHEGNDAISFSVATSETWLDKASNENREKTEWHKVVFYGAQAAFLSQKLRKGDRIYVRGMLRTRKWQSKSGEDHYTTEVHGLKFQLIDFREGSGAQESKYSNTQPSRASNQSAQPVAYGGDLDDDIPFMRLGRESFI